MQFSAISASELMLASERRHVTMMAESDMVAA